MAIDNNAENANKTASANDRENNKIIINAPRKNLNYFADRVV